MLRESFISRDAPLPAGWRYSVLRKVFMAISGLLLVGFLLGHWAGNTVLLQGEAAFDEYLRWLQAHPLLHYGVWLLIVAAIAAHLAIGPYHWYRSRRARPTRYRRKQNRATTWAARTMMVSGSLLLLFLLVHIAQVRGWISFVNEDSIYRNLRAGFTHWPILAIYLLGQLALAVHLYHGLWSQFQTLGIHHPRYNHWRRPIAAIIGIGLALLNISLVLLSTAAGQRWLEYF